MRIARLSLLAMVGGLGACSDSGRTTAATPTTASALQAAPAPASEPLAAAPAAASPTEPGRITSVKLGQAELHERFPVFPAAITPIEPIGERLVAHTLPMTVAYFETMARPIDVLEFYARHFHDLGYSIANPEESRRVVGHPALSATDPKDYAQLSVMVIGNGKDQPNTVILSIADMHLEALIPDEGELPEYPGAAPLTVRSTEAAGNASTIVFTTPDSADKVAAFYRAKMPQLGYLQLVEADAEATQLLFAKGGQRWQILIARQPDKTSVTAIGAQQQEDEP